MHREDQNTWLLGRLWERSEQQMDFLRDIKRQLVESHREVRERLEDGARDFRALAVMDATLGQKIQRNTDDISEIRRALAMGWKNTEDNRPRGIIAQLTGLLRTAKEFVEAVAPMWKWTVGLVLAGLMARGIINPEPYLKAAKAVLSGGSE